MREPRHSYQKSDMELKLAGRDTHIRHYEKENNEADGKLSNVLGAKFSNRLCPMLRPLILLQGTLERDYGTT